MVNLSFAVPQVREDALKVFSHEDLAGVDYAAVAFGSEAARDAALGPTSGMVEFVAIQSEWVVAAEPNLSRMHVGPAIDQTGFAVVAHAILKAKLEDQPLGNSVHLSVVIAGTGYTVMGDISDLRVGTYNLYSEADDLHLVERTGAWLQGFVSGAAAANA